ncbi:MAG: pyridoxamine 5'-phosphate oxidase family protein [Clostridia bacterium]|nr:pyridoxamine 5'-phosphate oxidase family protein [Clostridia bacterium]MDD4799130.1 pyridoxamine 5'-phosphate oxidase family protein [Clostridia bacterium]
MTKLPFDESRPKHGKMVLDEERILEILRDAHWGTLATVSADGEPHGVPVGFAYDEDKGCFYFHTANKGVKIDNIKRDSRVCFSIVGSAELVTARFAAQYESVVIYGNMQKIEDRQEAFDAALFYCNKFAPKLTAAQDVADMAVLMEKGFEYMAMYKLTPTHIGGKCRKVLAKD